MTKRDHKSSEQDWTDSLRQPEVTYREPVKASLKLTTVLKWIALACAVIVLVKFVGG